MIWELTFPADKDTCPAVFDFATTNGLKRYSLIKRIKPGSCLEITK
jgi:hypothetical protein